MLKTPIHKARHVPKAESLKGRRVSVPQEMFGFVDDDEFFFEGKVIETVTSSKAVETRCLIRFDYTGEEEWFPHALTRRWLLRQSTVAIDPICSLFATL